MRKFAMVSPIESPTYPTVEAFGPQQLVEFHSSSNPEEQAMQARRAYELVRDFLDMIG